MIGFQRSAASKKQKMMTRTGICGCVGTSVVKDFLIPTRKGDFRVGWMTSQTPG